MAVDLLKTTLAGLPRHPCSAPPPAPRDAAAAPPPAAAPRAAAPSAASRRPQGARQHRARAAGPVAEGLVVRAAPEPPLPRRPLLAAGGGWLGAGQRERLGARSLTATALGSRFGGRATVSAFGVDAEVSAEAGSARLGHALALGELVVALPLGARARPGRRRRRRRLAPGRRRARRAGLHRNRDRRWSAVGVAGVGLAWTLTPRLALALDARLLASATTTVVRLDGDEAARIGRALVFLTAGVGVRL